MQQDRRGELGLTLIVAYKLVKAALEIVLGVVVLVLLPALPRDIDRWMVAVRRHATEAWSVAAADKLVHAATGRHVLVVALAFVLDGAFSALEGWALHRRYAWSAWLVVGATSCLLPFELVALVRHPTVGRVMVLVVNVAIVAYLARRALVRYRRS